MASTSFVRISRLRLGDTCRQGAGGVSAAQLSRVLSDPAGSFPTLRAQKGNKDQRLLDYAAQLCKLVVDYAVKKTSILLSQLMDFQEWDGEFEEDRSDVDDEEGNGDDAPVSGAAPSPDEGAAAAGAAAADLTPPRKANKHSPDTEMSGTASVQPRKRRAHPEPVVHNMWQEGECHVHVEALSSATDLTKGPHMAQYEARARAACEGWGSIRAMVTTLQLDDCGVDMDNGVHIACGGRKARMLVLNREARSR